MRRFEQAHRRPPDRPWPPDQRGNGRKPADRPRQVR